MLHHTNTSRKVCVLWQIFGEACVLLSDVHIHLAIQCILTGIGKLFSNSYTETSLNIIHLNANIGSMSCIFQVLNKLKQHTPHPTTAALPLRLVT